MKKNILTLLSLATVGFVYGQRLPQDTILSAYTNQTSIRALNSITLKNGFYIPPPAAGKIVTISIAGFQTLVSKPSAGQNYILTRTFRSPGVTLANLNAQRTIGDENQTIQYFDGLGRPSQTVQLMASPNYRDIVQHIEYDGFGRESVKYLPHVKDTVKNGSFYAIAKADQRAYYAGTNTWDPAVVKTASPYAVTVFENSPLNRILQQGAPGISWQPEADRNLVAGTTGRTVATEYGTNGANDVKLWTVDATGNGAKATYYTAGKLYKTITKDENWLKANGRAGTVEEYKDFEDRVVLKRVWNINPQTNVEYPLETHYIYDDFGDLRYVVPPAVTAAGFTELATDPNFDKYIYAYKYDGRRRMVKKKVPGRGWDYLVYNKNDQVVFTRDAEQLKREEWSFIKYDAFGRVVMTGVEKGHAGDDHDALQKALAEFTGAQWEDRGTVLEGYTNNSIPQNTANMTVLQVNYYDSYDVPAIPFTAQASYSKQVKSLQTAGKSRVLGTTTWLWNVNYYDDYGRVVNSRSTNHLGGTDVVTNTYNFPGELLTSTRVHTPKVGNATTIITTNSYDHVGRLASIKEQIVGQAEVTLASNSYNEIGQLKTRSMGKTATDPDYVEAVSYSYNERGWTKRIASNNFTQSLMYQDGGTVRQYNGNIAQAMWRFTPTGATSTFEYGYDKLNRLTSGTNGQTGTASIAETMSYDDMGNIITLKRDALPVATYTYNGNKLTGFTSGLSGSYSYDDNGNAKTDRTGMAFNYNYLNLPQTAKKAGTDVAFLYDATGTKLQKISKIGMTAPITTKRDYVEGIEYNNDKIDIIHNSVGYAMYNGTGYVYHYNLTDHLGNVRTTLKRGATAIDVVQRDNYYPFGKRKVVAGGNNNYLYNGKEIQGELGDQYDYGARFYDAEIGRWNVVDPLADAAYDWSPYRYGYNNPIKFTDPTGMLETTEVEKQEDGTYKVRNWIDDGRRDIVVVNKNGERTGEVLGQSVTTHSFVDDDNNVVEGAIIDPKSSEGQQFLDKVEKDDPNLEQYLPKATNGEKYDFKVKDMDKNIKKDQSTLQYKYRGSKTKDGEYGSARDFGNMGAGLAAARNGLNWGAARFGFDTYQGYKAKAFGIKMIGGIPIPYVKAVPEPPTTQKAQMRGYIMGIQKYR